eukprot:Amastigsp_a5091_19.p3 type:complete len:106 gc:universal Amastigsp_a5091_19:58-375(+)
MAANADAELRRVRFEVFGKVQGVFFRKYTSKRASELGLTGWVRNTTKREKTVLGVVEGPPSDVAQMLDWLRTTGSPKSRIDRCVVLSDRAVSAREFHDFGIGDTE